MERDGQLHLLVSEAEEPHLRQVSCFSTRTPPRVALFLQASPQRDISRRTASFQYELLSNQSTTGPDFQKMALVEGKEQLRKGKGHLSTFSLYAAFPTLKESVKAPDS